jgi:uncharacterized membrane protein YqaE (UPF0057 family)
MLSVLTLLCPPAAVLFAGRRSEAAANVGLTLLLFVPGVVHARAVIGRFNDARRNERLMRLSEMYNL